MLDLVRPQGSAKENFIGKCFSDSPWLVGFSLMNKEACVGMIIIFSYCV